MNTLLMSTLLLGLSGFATQAHAQSATCLGSETATFNPPMTNTLRNLEITAIASYSTCVVTGVSGITSVTVDDQFTRSYSCTELLGGGSGTRVFNWSNGQSSTLSYTAYSQVVNGNYVIIFLGKVSVGLFQGQSATVVLTLASLSQANFLTACSGSGITSVNGPSSLTILPPL
ncbi:hypothetical protein AAHK20_00955 [Trinickia sp. YCB016]